MNIHLRIIEITNCPSAEAYRNSRSLVVSLDQTSLSDTCTLSGLETLNTKHLFKFKSSSDFYLLFSLIESKYGNYVIARLSLPFSWFPKNKIVRETFPMYPSCAIKSPMITIDIEISSEEITPFSHPYSGMNVQPLWKQLESIRSPLIPSSPNPQAQRPQRSYNQLNGYPGNDFMVMMGPSQNQRNLTSNHNNQLNHPTNIQNQQPQPELEENQNFLPHPQNYPPSPQNIPVPIPSNQSPELHNSSIMNYQQYQQDINSQQNDFSDDDIQIILEPGKEAEKVHLTDKQHQNSKKDQLLHHSDDYSLDNLDE